MLQFFPNDLYHGGRLYKIRTARVITLPISRVADDFKLDELYSLAPISLTTDWLGAPLGYGIELFSALSGKRLYFGGFFHKSPDFDRSYMPGSFREKLWERDIVELFLGDASGRYQEFNLAPSGAWWSAVFSGHRTLEHDMPRGVDAIARSTATEWRAAAAIDLSSLAIPLSEIATANITAVLGQNPRRYLSLGPNKLSLTEPDFHRTENWVPWDPRGLFPVRDQILAALSHPEAEEGLYFENLAVVHEEEERPAVVGNDYEILTAIADLIREGKIVADDSGEKPVFRLARNH